MNIIFTDLDGTLLDSDYSYSKAEDTVKEIKARGIAICIVTSKTFQEVVPLWRELKLESPFSFENGQGIAAPEGVLPEVDDMVEEFEILSLGPNYEELEKAIEEVEDELGDLNRFGDMEPGELADLTGLSEEESEKALERMHSEVFVPDEKAAKRLESKGYKVLEGTDFFHLQGRPDKGTAVRYIKDILDPDVTLSIGDAENDYPMFKETDYSVLLGAERSEDVEAKKIEKKGPEGWNEGVKWFLDKLDL